jgi:hypothetical protein
MTDYGEYREPMPAPIAEAIVYVQEHIRRLGTNEKNQHGGYKYVSVDKFYEIVGPMMASAGLFVIVTETSADVMMRQGSKGEVAWLTVKYELTFAHKSGAVARPMQRTCILPLTGPQTFGAAQSYIEKQLLRQVFKVPTGEQDADAVAQDDGKLGPDITGMPDDGWPGPTYISKAQREELEKEADELGVDKRKFCEYLKVESISQIDARDFSVAKNALDAKRKAAAKQAPVEQKEAAE